MYQYAMSTSMSHARSSAIGIMLFNVNVVSEYAWFCDELDQVDALSESLTVL